MKWHPPLGNPMPPNSVLTVSELLRSVRDALERRFPLLWVRGELSNLSRAPSGHCYFTLKDAAAQVDCVMFRSRAAALDWEPRDGAQVEVCALVTLYEPRGRRSEEHTSELQSQSNLVCRLLLEKKKQILGSPYAVVGLSDEGAHVPFHSN